MRRTLVIAGVLLALLLAGGVLLMSQDSEEVMCSAEGLILPDGELVGRSTSHDCRFVDDDGNVLTTRPDGDPLCYDPNTQIVPCSDPGAREPR